MPKFRLQGFQTIANDGNGTSTAGGFLPTPTGVAITDEADRQFKDYGGHTYEDLYANVTAFAGDDTVTITFAENGTGSSNLTVAASGTGIVRDGTGTEVATADDLISCDHIDDGGMHSDAHTVSDNGVVASGGVAGIVGGGDTSSITTSYLGLWGEIAGTIVARQQTRIHRDYTFSNLRGFAGSATGTWDVAPFDGVAASTNITIQFTGTGAVEDTTGTEAYTSGEDLSFRLLESVTGALDLGTVQMDSDIDEVPRGGAISSINYTSTDQFTPFVGGRLNPSTTDTAGVTKHDSRISTEDMGNLSVFVFSVSSPSSARLALRLNTTISSNVTVAPSGSGLITDTTGTETLAEDDEVSFLGDTASGSFIITSAYIEMPTLAAAGEEIALTGVAPASTGVLTEVWTVFLTGNAPASTGDAPAEQSLFRTLTGSAPASTGVLTQIYLIPLAGDAPASTGVLGAPLYLIVLTGNAPASTGILSVQQSLLHTLTGNAPASTGAITLIYLIVLAGNLPASTGVLEFSLGVEEIGLTGNAPASTGVIAVQYQIVLAGAAPASAGVLTFVWTVFVVGNAPSSTGVVSAQQTLLRALTGNAPASTGILTQVYLIVLTGNAPASTGALVFLYVIALTGNAPASTGVLGVQQSLFLALTGNAPASTGVLTLVYLIPLAGVAPASTGVLTFVWTVFLTGNAPASTGVLSAQQTLLRALTGNAPASTGALALLYLIVLVGNLPASTGVVTDSGDQSLVGDAPASTGTLSIVYLISVTGELPNATGTLGASVYFIALTGSVPAATGALGFVYLIALTGNAPTSTGVLVPLFQNKALSGVVPASTGDATIIYLIVLTGNQPQSSAINFIPALLGNFGYVLITIAVQSTGSVLVALVVQNTGTALVDYAQQSGGSVMIETVTQGSGAVVIESAIQGGGSVRTSAAKKNVIL